MDSCSYSFVSNIGNCPFLLGQAVNNEAHLAFMRPLLKASAIGAPGIYWVGLQLIRVAHIERFGPIRNIKCIPLVPPEPRWWIYTCDLARTPAGTLYSPYHFGAAGASVDPEEALRRALGEAVERYCGMHLVKDYDVILADFKENKISKQFPRCAKDESCPDSFKGLEPSLALPHVKINSLTDNEKVLVPVDYVHLNLSMPQSNKPVTLPISTGLAFYTSLDMAIWKGLCEVAERDAMMLMWWNKINSPEIRFDRGKDLLPEQIATRIHRINQVGLTVKLFDITSDFYISTVFCVVSGRCYPYFVTGAACNPNPVIACTKAIDEAVSIRLSLRHDKWSREIPSLNDFKWLRNLDQHMTLYANWKNTPAFDFLLNQNNEYLSFENFINQPWWNPPANKDELILFAKHLKNNGLTVLWAELTT